MKIPRSLNEEIPFWQRRIALIQRVKRVAWIALILIGLLLGVLNVWAAIDCYRSGSTRPECVNPDAPPP